MSRHLSALAAILILAACSEPPADHSEAVPENDFVGSAQCASCHQAEFSRWQGSHHQLAMQAADEDTVLGDFSGQVFAYFDTETSFFRRDGGYFISTQNASGEDEEFRISHTFGVAPLQQYLVEAPGGRLQALQVAWDTRPAAEGGQRWYHLYPDEYIGPDDPLHWTGRYFTWNTMCAECHSTDLRVNFHAVSKTFDTTFSEISVGCEACHGPGSIHADQAERQDFDGDFGLTVNLDDRGTGAWIMNPQSGIAELSQPGRRQQPESCGRCHARRALLTDDYEYGKPLADTHLVSFLEEHLYHADGRIQDEVYVYGSFVQSKMYAAGVTCGDCHDPHSASLRAGPDPNDTCTLCHLRDKFAAVEHSPENTGDCVSCHMPATTYMGVDGRRDHSFRLPDTSADPDHYGMAIAAGREGQANTTLLTAIADRTIPPIARATMLTLLEQPDDAAQFELIAAQLDDPSPLVKIGALRTLQGMSVEQRGTTGSGLLRDPVRAVRIEAARAFLHHGDLLEYEDAKALTAATAEYRQSLIDNLYWPESALQLAELESTGGEQDAARRRYEFALELDDEFAAAHLAFGMFLVRNGEHDKALRRIARAYELAPQVAHFAYVYGVALNSMGKSDEAIRILSDARREFPEDFDIAWALATMLRDTGDGDALRALLDEMVMQFPGDPRVRTLIESLVE